MTDSGSDFKATIDTWALKSEKRITAIFKEAAQRFVSKSQGRIPVDTGFARASIRASTSSMPQIDPGSKGEAGKAYAYDPGLVLSVIGTWHLGEPLYVGWTASYVSALERGHSKQAPSGFIRVTALEWPQIVSGVVADAKARVGGA